MDIGVIIDCENTGKISGNGKIGGIVGELTGEELEGERILQYAFNG